MTTAVVFYDVCETEYVARLYNELNACGVRLIAVPEGMPIDVLPNIHFIVYRDPLLRIPDPAGIANFAKKCGFEAVVADKTVICCHKSLLRKEWPYATAGTNFFKAQHKLHYSIPPNDMLPILMVVHKRVDYFTLTMNSLLYSLHHDADKVPIHILLSRATTQMKEACLSLAEKHSNIVLYESENNVGGAGFNLLMQWVEPNRFTIWEEDFIMPQVTREVIPYWNRRFNNRLDFYDLTGFITSKINAPGSFRSNVADTLWTNHAQVTGNSLTISLDKYRSAKKSVPNYISADGTLVTTYPNSSFCTVQGYHIGFNQEMDGHPALFDMGRFKECNSIGDEQTVFCLSNGASGKFLLSNFQ